MKRSPANGFTLLEIMIVVSIIGLLAAMAMPGFMRARARARKEKCVNNQRLIDSAVDMAALDNGWPDGYEIQDSDTPTLAEYAKGGTNNIYCPDGGEYEVRHVGSPTTCSYPGHSQTQAAEVVEEPEPGPVLPLKR